MSKTMFRLWGWESRAAKAANQRLFVYTRLAQLTICGVMGYGAIHQDYYFHKVQAKFGRLFRGDSREGDFDLQKSPVSVQEGVKLFSELGTRRCGVVWDIERQCQKKCEAELRPCSILLQVEAMHHGAEWKRLSEQPAPPRSIEAGLKIQDQLKQRRSTSFYEAQRQCDKDCRAGLKPCPIMHRLEDMHKETDCHWAR